MTERRRKRLWSIQRASLAPSPPDEPSPMQDDANSCSSFPDDASDGSDANAGHTENPAKSDYDDWEEGEF